MRKYLYLFVLVLSIGIFTHLNTRAQQGQTYESAIKSGEEMLSAKEYISAKTYFEIALRLKEDDPYARQKLNETLELLQKQMQLQESFFQKMDLGDRLYRDGKLEEALKAYNEALELIPTDTYTLGQVEKINTTIRKEKERNENYRQSMELGDKLLAENRYEEALVQYELAGSIFPEDELPKQKIIEVQELLSEQIEKENQFNAFLLEAERLIARRDYDGGIEKYQLALDLFPEDNAIKQKLSETIALRDKALAYEEVLAKADELYAEKAFREARTFYEQALEIWPEQTYPSDMLGRITATINDQDFINEEAFNKLISTANEHYDQDEFEQALTAYQQANELKPGEAIVIARITEIESIFAERERLENLEENYAKAMSEGNQAMAISDYTTAIDAFRQASSLKPDEQEPRDLLAQAENRYDSLLEKQQNQELYETTIASADQFMDEQAWEDARNLYVKAAELPVDVSYAQTQIERIDDLLKQAAEEERNLAAYNNFMMEADALFNQNQFVEARDNYAEALNLQPDESLPRERINEIDQILEQQQAEAEALEATYNQLIEEADLHYEEARLNEALLSYKQALEIKPEELKPQNRIREIEQQLAQLELEAEAEIQYEHLIAEADKLFADDNPREAKAQYLEALSIFEDRTYPREQINKIDELLAEREAELEMQSRYEQFILLADQLFEQQQWELAKTNYLEASAIFPDEIHPSEQINQIDEKLAELDMLAELEESYNEQLAIADQQFDSNLLEDAKQSYSEALKIKPDEIYPTERIERIDQMIAELNAAEEKASRIAELLNQAENFMTDTRYDEAETKLNEVLLLEPGQQDALAVLAEIVSIREEINRKNQEKYQEFISIGDQYLSEKDYREAITAFKTARSYIPEDEYANQKIAEAEGLLREYMMAVTTEYNKLINEADRHYNAKAYDRAIESYTNAERVNPYETYPREMIRKIAQTIEDNKLVEVNISPVQVLANTTQRFEFPPVNVSERRTNYVIIKARNLGDNEFPLIFSYGSQTGRNGGFVLPIPSSEEYQDYVIRIGSQYRWFSEDNNWFTLSPENGDIEIGLVQISRGN